MPERQPRGLPHVDTRIGSGHNLLVVRDGACGAPDGGGADSSEAAIVQQPRPATPVVAAPMSKEIHWLRNSAEYRALTRQVYAAAGQAVDTSALRRKSGSWAVVSTSTRTVLDNSPYQKENQGQPFSAAAWTSWVLRKEAKAVPGVTHFTRHVHELGGQVVLVNRMDATKCPATEENLGAIGITYDAILCKKDTSDKNVCFKSVAAGTAMPGLPALEIVGDNIQDFPHQSQELASKDDAAPRTPTSAVLPNPMYGAWEKNPQN